MRVGSLLLGSNLLHGKRYVKVQCFALLRLIESRQLLAIKNVYIKCFGTISFFILFFYKGRYVFNWGEWAGAY